MGEITTDVNWIATVVGAAIAFALGWLWYSPKLFGHKWAQGVRISFDDKTAPPMMAMLTQAIATFLLAWVVAVTAVNDALLTIILITLTIVVMVISSGLFAQKSRYAIATEAGYIVAMVVVMIICQGVI
jgi:hypothetical protein